MARSPAGETRILVTPQGMPPPVAIGDKLPGGLTVCQLCQRYVLGGKVIWQFYVQRGSTKAMRFHAIGTVKNQEAQASLVKESSQPDFAANLLTA